MNSIPYGEYRIRRPPNYVGWCRDRAQANAIFTKPATDRSLILPGLATCVASGDRITPRSRIHLTVRPRRNRVCWCRDFRD